MRTILFLAVGLLLMAGAPAGADDCCNGGDCCATAQCCNTQVTPSTNPLPGSEPAPPVVREYAEVMFYNPVWVGGKVLMGKHIIEHDNDRMAKGGPCTHIYADDDRTTPVVTFHCTHLIRPRTPQSTVTVVRDYNALGNGYVLTEFQFAGSTDAHGVPDARGSESNR
jgi:hypothetical protein